MTVQEVAEYLRIRERKVYDLLAQKRIPCRRENRSGGQVNANL
ncbi:MAG: helix-turn-helix domain-containing protein [Methylococcales bacterium]